MHKGTSVHEKHYTSPMKTLRPKFNCILKTIHFITQMNNIQFQIGENVPQESLSGKRQQGQMYT